MANDTDASANASAAASSAFVLGGDWLCGESEDLWDSSASWDSSGSPSVGVCFQSTLWLLPPALFWLLLPASLWSAVFTGRGWRGRRRRSDAADQVFPRWSPLVLAKLAVTACLACVAVWDIVFAAQVHRISNKTPFSFLHFAILFYT